MPALLGLLLGALIGHWLSRDWGAAVGGLIGFFAGALLSGRTQRAVFRKPEPAPPQAITLEQRVAALERRLAVLETGRSAASGIPDARSGGEAPGEAADMDIAAGVSPSIAALPAAAVPPGVAVPVPPAMPPPVPPASVRPAAVAPGVASPALARLWGWFTGGNAMTRIGVIVLFFGVAFLLRYFAEHFTVPISVRLLAVALVGIALVIAGWRIARTRPAYGWSLQGAGTGMLYLTTFAAFRQFDLLPASVALILLAAIAALTIWLALVADAQPLAGLALAGAFLAPVLTGSDAKPIPLFAYFAVVNGVVLVIAASRTWRSINALGFVFTFALALFWGDRYYQPESFRAVEPFLVLFFGMYVAVAILQARREPVALRQPLDGLLVFGMPMVAFALQVALVSDTRYGAAWSALALAAIYAGLAWWLRARTVGAAALARSFVGLAVVFASMSIPFAFDNRVTAALWSVEGALVYWLGIEQRTPPIRIFALLLQAAAGVLFVLHGVQGDDGRLFLNAFFMGGAMLAVAGLATARLADRRAQVLGPRELTAVPLVFAWGALWWLASGGLELTRQLPAAQEPHAVLTWVVAAAAAALWLRRLLAWPRLLALALALPVAMVFIGLRDAERTHTTLLQAGWLAWPAAWVVLFLALFAVDATVVPTRTDRAKGTDWRDAAHVLAAIALTGHVAWEVSEWVGRITADDTVWVACAAAMPAIVYLALAPRARAALRWPFDRHGRAYALHAAVPIAILLMLWVLLVNLLSPGEPYPLPYFPLANPLDITLAAALLVLFRWSAIHPGVDERARYALLGVGIFLSLNGALLRIGHHWGDIPWDLPALLGSKPLQASLTLAWSVTGATLMFVAAKRNLRPAVDGRGRTAGRRGGEALPDRSRWPRRTAPRRRVPRRRHAPVADRLCFAAAARRARRCVAR